MAWGFQGDSCSPVVCIRPCSSWPLPSESSRILALQSRAQLSCSLDACLPLEQESLSDRLLCELSSRPARSVHFECLELRSSAGDPLCLQGLAMSGLNVDAHSCVGWRGCYWHLMAGGQGCRQARHGAQHSPTREGSSPTSAVPRLRNPARSAQWLIYVC